MWEVLRSQKDACEGLAERSGDGTETGQKLDRGSSPYEEELALLRDSDRLHLVGTMAPKSGEGWNGGRWVGAVEE